MSSTPISAPVLHPGRVKQSPRRMDIQGLRAICMIQVLLYHAWTIGSPVGVDAFIMISAFLMTSSFLRRADLGQMPFFLERWANTFKRLLPPLVFVVLATLAGTFAFLPASRWQEQIIESFASITYWQNWRLAHVSADYYASDNAAASPLQHLWSMSMQGQVFLIWPVLLTLCVLIARRMGRSVHSVAFWAFTLLTVLSLAWLLLLSPTDGSVYFDTRARIWEFSFGSAIAAISPKLHVPDRVRPWLTWAALGTLILYFLVSIGTYPGPMAFVPMAAVSILLLFPSNRGPASTGQLLSNRALTKLGDNSYAVYLVHWPIFVFYLVLVGQSQLGWRSGLVLIAISILLSVLVTKYLDKPFQSGRWPNASLRNKSLVVGASLLVGLIPVSVAWFQVSSAQAAEMQADTANLTVDERVDNFPGASVLFEEFPVNFRSLSIPAQIALSTEWAIFETSCTEKEQEVFNQGPNNTCSRQVGASEDALRVLIAGNSHAQQNILPQVQPLIDERGWDAIAILKGACSWGSPQFFDGECVDYNNKVEDFSEEYKPDLAFLMVTRSAKDSPNEQVLPGVEELVRSLTNRGIQVFGVRDSLRSETNLYECSNERPKDKPWGGCLLDRSNYFPSSNPAGYLESIQGFTMIDMTDAYCTESVCPTIIGNVFTYIDTNHLSRQYSQTVAPYFAEKVMSRISE